VTPLVDHRFDLTFLCLAVENALTDRASAKHCVRLIRESAASGEPLSAPEVAVHLGILDEATAGALAKLARERLVPEQTAPEHPDVPATLEGFEIVARLGSGNAGVALEGRRSGETRPLVLKVLSPRFATRPLLLEQILSSVRRSLLLTDPRIVPLLEVAKADGYDVFVHEKAEGIHLPGYVTARPTASAVRS
jgi:hypothetical protein